MSQSGADQPMNNQVSRGFFLVLLAAVAYAAFRLLLPWATAWVVAIVVVITAYPLHQRLYRRLGQRRYLAAGISTLLLCLVVALPITALGLGAAGQAAGLVAEATDQAAQVSLEERVQSGLDMLPYTWRSLARGLDLDSQRLTSFLLDGAKTASVKVFGLVGGAVSLFAFAGVVVFGVFYLFLDGERLARRLLEYSPLPPDTDEALVQEILLTTRATVKSTLLLALFQGLLDTLGLWVLGMPLVWLWGSAVVVASTVPMMGAALVWVPAAVYLALANGWPEALGLAVWCGVVNLVTDNLLRPRLISRDSHNHPLLVFAAVLGGLTVFGLSGLILGPVILSVLSALMAAYHKHLKPKGA